MYSSMIHLFAIHHLDSHFVYPLLELLLCYLQIVKLKGCECLIGLLVFLAVLMYRICCLCRIVQIDHFSYPCPPHN